jgi:hypothetical protein
VKLIIEIDMDNAAFHEEGGPLAEAFEIIGRAIVDMVAYPVSPPAYAHLIDSNGNDVGLLKVVE